MAPVAYTLWRRFLRFDPDWPNRDRFGSEVALVADVHDRLQAIDSWAMR